MIIYVGDSSRTRERIRRDHCSGNVYGSALRRHVAKALGYSLRPRNGGNGSEIDLTDPSVGEAAVSTYIRGGRWRVIACRTVEESKDFQWFAVDRLKPQLNRDRKDWDRANEERYNELLRMLQEVPLQEWGRAAEDVPGPGVYVLEHEQLPRARSGEE